MNGNIRKGLRSAHSNFKFSEREREREREREIKRER